MNSKSRCTWANNNPLLEEYHDTEWGVPERDDHKLFEFLVLESAQAGLSWLTILKRRQGYKQAFANFDPKKVAQFTNSDVEKLLKNEKIIRNRAKIESTINNAKRFLEVQKEFESFANYSWKFVNNKPIKNKITNDSDYQAVTKEAEEFAKDLKKRGFRFLGPTTIYAHMQAVGMVNDHMLQCFRRNRV